MDWLYEITTKTLAMALVLMAYEQAWEKRQR